MTATNPLAAWQHCCSVPPPAQVAQQIRAEFAVTANPTSTLQGIVTGLKSDDEAVIAAQFDVIQAVVDVLCGVEDRVLRRLEKVIGRG